MIWKICVNLHLLYWNEIYTRCIPDRNSSGLYCHCYTCTYVLYRLKWKMLTFTFFLFFNVIETWFVYSELIIFTNIWRCVRIVCCTLSFLHSKSYQILSALGLVMRIGWTYTSWQNWAILSSSCRVSRWCLMDRD